MGNYHTQIYTNKSIAVLLSADITNDSENEYFSNGITDEIVDALTRIEGLKVVAD